MRDRDALRAGVTYWWEATIEDDATGEWAEMDGTTEGVEGVTVGGVRAGLLKRMRPSARITRFDMGEVRR